PRAPTTESNKYTCQPAYYSSTGTNSLAPGTYYWWMTFFRAELGASFPTLHISGPSSFVVPQPTAPAGVSLTSPANGASSIPPVAFTFSVPANASFQLY